MSIENGGPIRCCLGFVAELESGGCGMRWKTIEHTVYGIYYIFTSDCPDMHVSVHTSSLYTPQVHEMLGDVLLDMHNIHHYQRFMSQVRDEIQVPVHGSYPPADCFHCTCFHMFYIPVRLMAASEDRRGILKYLALHAVRYIRAVQNLVRR